MSPKLATLLIAAAIVAVFVAPAGAESEFAQPGAIEGTVTASPGKVPVEGVEVCASASVQGEWFTQCEETKGNGDYEVIGLPEAIYRVQFSSGEGGKNLATQYYRNTTNPNDAKLIQIDERETVTNIDAEMQPKAAIFSASWGTDNAVGCPNGAQGLDNIPVTFSWFIRRSSIQTGDFRIVRSDGSVAKPTCALQFPPNERDEAQTVNLIGDFGDSVNGPTPKTIRVVGALDGKAPGAKRWGPLPKLRKVGVDPISGGPYIVDAWMLTPSIYRGDRNRCATGGTFVRVMWSNGLTAYPYGEEVGAAVTASYRAIYRLPNGIGGTVAPLEVADLYDHESSFNADNMHDLCLPKLPRKARLTAIVIPAELIEDPNGDPNPAQAFLVQTFKLPR